jgi:hypothetical protein
MDPPSDPLLIPLPTPIHDLRLKGKKGKERRKDKQSDSKK